MSSFPRISMTRWALAAAALLVALLGCAGAGVVRKFCEPIDRSTCVLTCERAGMAISRYEYATDACWCALPGGGEHKAYETLGR